MEGYYNFFSFLDLLANRIKNQNKVKIISKG
jgi:hypothetical protein